MVHVVFQTFCLSSQSTNLKADGTLVRGKYSTLYHLTVFSQSVVADDILVVRKCVGSCSLPGPLTVLAVVTKDNNVTEQTPVFDPEFAGFNARLFRIGINLVDK